MPTNYISTAFHTVTPYIIVSGVAQLIDFMKRTFSAEEIERMAAPDGTIRHAEVRIGDSIIMMGEASNDWPSMPQSLYVYVPDTDATYARALEAGATSLMEPADQFYGDRNAGVRDSCGNVWWLATHIEDVSREEMARRAESQYKQ